MPHYGQQSFLVPLASAHLPAFEPQGRRLRDELHQKMTAHADRFDPDEADWIAPQARASAPKALGTLSDTAGGTLVPLPMLGELIDLQRNLEVFATAGAQEVALPPNGRIQFPKLTGGVDRLLGRRGDRDHREPADDRQPRPAGQEARRVREAEQRAAALRQPVGRGAGPARHGPRRGAEGRPGDARRDRRHADQGAASPTRGITTHTASTTGANGDTFEPQDVALMESKLPDAVDAPTAWVMRKAMFAALMNRRADAVAAQRRQGAVPASAVRRRRADAPPAELYGTKVVRSAQVSDTRVKGAATNLTYILLGYFPDWIVARMGVMEFLASGLGDTALQNDQTVPARHPAHRRRPAARRELRAVRPVGRRVTLDSGRCPDRERGSEPHHPAR